MAMAAAAHTSSSTVLSSLLASRPSLLLSNRNFLLTLRVNTHPARPPPVRFNSTVAAAASGGGDTKFKISFGAGPRTAEVDTVPKDPASSPVVAAPSLKPGQLLIPWIVRDENGNLTLSTTPPASFVQAMAEEKASTAAKKDRARMEKSKKAKPTPAAASASPPKYSKAAPPKYSKAARRYYNENIRGQQQQRLSKVLAAAGVASRRSCEELIFEGKVTVNGSICKLPQTQVDPLKDAIYVNGNRLSKKLPPKLYFAVNKPKGYICSNGEESKSVISLFDDYWKTWSKRNPGVPQPRLFTIGRLDVATSGLIVVTNDGDFAQDLAHPSSNITKEYIATIEGAVHKRHLIALSEGTEIEGVHCTPDFVELLPTQPGVSKSRVRIVVHEGRNHEVREIVKSAGLEVHALKRVRIGRYRLPSDLGLGKYVELKPSDLKLFGVNGA